MLRISAWLEETKQLPKMSEDICKKLAALSKSLGVPQKKDKLKKPNAVLLGDCCQKLDDMLKQPDQLSRRQNEDLKSWAEQFLLPAGQRAKR